MLKTAIAEFSFIEIWLTDQTNKPLEIEDNVNITLGDFNTKSSNWYKHDQTTYEGSRMDAVTSQFGLQQLIKEPTHILGNSSSCIDLIFTSQPSLVMESGVHPSLHSNCHHQITYAKFNQKIHYPPPYVREIWHYQKANIDQDITLSAMNLNDDLKKINKWAFQWKISFNPDPNKQAQEVIFSRKFNKPDHPSLNFNNMVVIQSTTHKHLGMILDTKLDFQEHLKDKLSKISKTIGLLRKLQKILTRHPLITIYKLFIKPHLDYGDIIYDKAYNSSFHQNLEKIQYNSALAITGAIRGTSKEKLYQELGLESLEKRRWYRKLCYFYKIFNKQSPTYLLNVIPVSSRSYFSRYAENVPSFKVRHDFF